MKENFKPKKAPAISNSSVADIVPNLSVQLVEVRRSKEIEAFETALELFKKDPQSLSNDEMFVLLQKLKEIFESKFAAGDIIEDETKLFMEILLNNLCAFEFLPQEKSSESFLIS